MKKDEIEKQIEELTRVRPELLNEEALKLFNLIMNRLDYIEELEKELKEKNEDIHKLEEELKEAKDNEESANSIVSDLLDEIEKKDKLITEMSEQLIGLSIVDDVKDIIIFKNKEEVLEYFGRKIENEEKRN